MEVHQIEAVHGAYLAVLDRHHDERGYFQEIFRDSSIVQANVSFSKKNVLRGLHVANFSKLCTVVRGRVFDVIADVREGSPTYGQWCGVWLDDKEHKQLFVPPGCAHGFFVAEDDTLFLYHQDGVYNPENNWSINWLDRTLNILWPHADQYIMSEKDRKAKEWLK